jgi:hypothetical protein
MTLAHSSALAGEPCAGCSKFPTCIYYSAHEIPIAQLLHRVVKGTPVVLLNTVTHAIHFRLLTRQIHNSRILPTAAASRPARLRRSLPAAALLFSSPTAPSVTMVTRTQLLACRRTSGQPKDGWRGSVDIVPGHDDEPAASGHESPWIRPFRLSREQLLHSRQRLVLLEPPTSSLSSATKICYIFMSMWIN